MKKILVSCFFTFIIFNAFSQSGFNDDIKIESSFFLNEGFIINNLNDGSDLNPGFKGIVELGYLLNVENQGSDKLKLNLIGAFDLNPYFSMGLGSGLRYYVTTDDVFIPLLIDVRFTFSRKDFSPYLSLIFGYSFDAKNNFRDLGILLNPSFGVRFKVSAKTFMNIGFSFEYQKEKVYSSYFSSDASTDSKALGLTAGITF